MSERLANTLSQHLRTAQIRRVWRGLVNACKLRHQARVHAGKRDATGVDGVGARQEHAMPKPHHHQAT